MKTLGIRRQLAARHDLEGVVVAPMVHVVAQRRQDHGEHLGVVQPLVELRHLDHLEGVVQRGEAMLKVVEPHSRSFYNLFISVYTL